MPIIISSSLDPYFNLATEEYFLKNDIFDEDILFLWQGNRAFVIGRNQNPFTEVNPKYFDTEIPIIRRISGGGTIFQDESTIDFSIITKKYMNRINDYLYFLKPIIDFLNELGVKATFKPKSHIFVGDYKISGNAQAFINNKLLHHGTLLFNTNLNIIYDALVDFESEASENHISSNKQKVINISELLNFELSIDEFKLMLVKSISSSLNIENHYYILNEEDIDKINNIAQNKYKSWDWNLGKTKEFQAEVKINSTQIKFKIINGIIADVDIIDYRGFLGLKYLSQEYFRMFYELNSDN